ncbi:hypothetical protein GCG54_00012102 [Colletotrichum gloeosporioides]|uniref:Uncharacterized protein n=1 Tax=Colletotrichum gloeosporioides TaxID=474922 RepID=A0A8H4CIU7_COLGL|nr:uncharacterized protein GCG54_00012102 [Colletotrichum gloeosporioides]KAF3804614.1 hypothetical protein GCG54_00012102 [Colletotrichum gloeosporioides]
MHIPSFRQAATVGMAVYAIAAIAAPVAEPEPIDAAELTETLSDAVVARNEASMNDDLEARDNKKNENKNDRDRDGYRNCRRGGRGDRDKDCNGYGGYGDGDDYNSYGNGHGGQGGYNGGYGDNGYGGRGKGGYKKGPKKGPWRRDVENFGGPDPWDFYDN